MSQLKITPWQIYRSDEVVDLPAKITDGNKAFEHKDIPGKRNPHWKTWHQGADGRYSFDESSTLNPNMQLRFTYMQTMVEIPTDYDLQKFEVSFSHVDDGARIYVFNADNPSGETKLDWIRGNSVHSADLKQWVKKGVVNRVVVVQFDWARLKNTLNNLQIKVNGTAVAAPRLGSLRLVSYSTEQAAGGTTVEPDVKLDDKPSVELILDASGSMTDNMEPSKKRWNVAKEVLEKVIDDDLNESMHVAFRVFGGTGDPLNKGTKTTVNSGYTTLVQPLAKLNKSALKGQIAGIRPGGQTPIAGSLKKVIEDLQGAQGARSIVVLITDGNENCGGDVLETIEELNESEVDVVLNVVGFAITQPNLKAKFTEWAQAGNGNYYDATDRQLFEHQLIKAINVSYWAKPELSRGRTTGYIDGPAIDIPAGSYSITVDPEDAESTMNIGSHEVKAGELKEITVERW